MKFPTWLMAIAIIGVLGVAMGVVKIPTFAVTGMSVTTPSTPASQTCELTAGQTMSTSVTSSGVLLGNEGTTIGTPVYTGIIGKQRYTAQAAGTAVTRDKGSPYSIFLYNATTNILPPYYIEGTIPCSADNYVIDSAKLAAMSGLTETAYDNDGITALSTTHSQTFTAGGSATLRIRLQANQSYGVSNSYFTNPQINKMVAFVNLADAGAGTNTTLGAVDASASKMSIDGVDCPKVASLYAANNGMSMAFECPVDIHTGLNKDVYFYVKAVSGQTPDGFMNVTFAPVTYFTASDGTIKAGVENEVGTLNAAGLTRNLGLQLG